MMSMTKQLSRLVEISKYLPEEVLGWELHMMLVQSEEPAMVVYTFKRGGAWQQVSFHSTKEGDLRSVIQL